MPFCVTTDSQYLIVYQCPKIAYWILYHEGMEVCERFENKMTNCLLLIQCHTIILEHFNVKD